MGVGVGVGVGVSMRVSWMREAVDSIWCGQVDLVNQT